MAEVFNFLMCIAICIFVLKPGQSYSQGIRTKDGCLGDVCFILDKSGGLHSTNWVPIVHFLETFVEKLTISDSATKVGVVTFDDFGQLVIELNGYGSKDELLTALELLKLTPKGIGRRVDAGLMTARTECFTSRNGDRSDAPNIAVLITNGDSDFYYANLQSDELRLTGAVIFAIAVGLEINHNLLEAVANGKDNVFSDVDFGRLVEDTSLILGRSCSAKESCTGNDLNNLDTGVYPSMNDCPRLSTPLIEEDEFYFQCFVNYTSQGEDERYKVTFLFDEVPDTNVPVIDLSPPETVATLNQYYLRGHMGKLLSCEVRTFREGNQGTSTPVSSQSYWIGITFSHRVVDVYETDNRTDTPLDNVALLYVYSTLPILCPNAVTTDCDLGLAIESRGSLAVFQHQGDLIRKCYFKFFPEDWKENESVAYNQDRPLEVIAKRMAVKQTIREGSISMVTRPMKYTWEERVQYSPWENYIPETIPVLIHGGHRRGLCKSITDPHMTTFDGLKYDVMGVGVYKLVDVRNKLTIQVKHCQCPNRRPCSYNCGIAVNDRGRIQIIDREGGRLHIIKCLQETQTVTANPQRTKYIIRTSNGVMITVTLLIKSVWNNNDALNIHVDVPATFFGIVNGLCGNFDDKKENEFYIARKMQTLPESDFEQQWKVETVDSNYFNCEGAEQPVDEEFCQCEGTGDQNAAAETSGTVCGLDDPLLLIGRTGDQVKALLPGFIKANAARRQRKKRSTEDELFTDDVDDSYGMTDLNDYPTVPEEEVPAWGTFGISEAQANEHCILTMENSPSYAVCREQLSEELAGDIIRNCVSDIQITGDLTSANSIETSIQEECVFNFLSTITVDDSETPISDPVVAEFVVSFGVTTCPKNCSGKGTCSDGICTCVENFHGADCSIEKRTPPANVMYLAPVLCDTQDRPCRSALLQAENIVNSGLLACKVTVTKTGSVPKVYIYNTTLLTADTVLCPLPDPNSLLDIKLSVYMYTYSISLTNEGEVFSELPSQQQHRRVWNSDWIWESCFQKGIFLNKNETCEIDGECYTAGTQKNDCTCSPSKNGEEWSNCKVSGGGGTQFNCDLMTLSLVIFLFTEILLQ